MGGIGSNIGCSALLFPSPDVALGQGVVYGREALRTRGDLRGRARHVSREELETLVDDKVGWSGGGGL